ncbi:2342_t:CDS:2 [Entrophospora sp. SA101]|nr:2342_t:CDS:2 [Entrophospora sp. SA101]
MYIEFEHPKKILSEKSKEIKDDLYKSAKSDKLGITLTFDGWKNVVHQKLLGVVLINSCGKNLIWDVKDISGDLQNWNVVYKYATDLFEELRTQEIKILSLVTDSASENVAASAIFRLRGFSTSKSTSTLAPNKNTLKFNPIKLIGDSTTSTDEMSMDLNDSTLSTANQSSSSEPVTATLGIAIEPISIVEAELATLPPSNLSNTNSATNSTTIPNFDLINQITMNILKNLYNYVTSFATTSIPFGSDAIGTGNSFLSLKLFQEWYDSYTRKVKMDPNMVLKEDNPL